MQECPLTAAQCRMARAALRLTLDDLVKISGVGRATIARLENGDTVKSSTAALIRGAFELRGMRFIDEGEHAGGIWPSLTAEVQ